MDEVTDARNQDGGISMVSSGRRASGCALIERVAASQAAQVLKLADPPDPTRYDEAAVFFG